MNHHRKRRVSVQDHADWLHSLLTSGDIDEIEEVVVDPLVEQFAKPRSEREARGVLAVLDELERSRKNE